MNRWKGLLFMLACLSYIGCATLWTDQAYILINRPVDGKATFHGEIYWLPESADIRKILPQPIRWRDLPTMGRHGKIFHSPNVAALMIGLCFKVNCMSQVKKASDVGAKRCKRGNIRWMDCPLITLKIQMTDRTSIVSLSAVGTYLPG